MLKNKVEDIDMKKYTLFLLPLLLTFVSLLLDPRIEGLTAAGFEATHNPIAAIAKALFAVPFDV